MYFQAPGLPRSFRWCPLACYPQRFRRYLPGHFENRQRTWRLPIPPGRSRRNRTRRPGKPGLQQPTAVLSALPDCTGTHGTPQPCRRTPLSTAARTRSRSVAVIEQTISNALQATPAASQKQHRPGGQAIRLANHPGELAPIQIESRRISVAKAVDVGVSSQIHVVPLLLLRPAKATLQIFFFGERGFADGHAKKLRHGFHQAKLVITRITLRAQDGLLGQLLDAGVVSTTCSR